MGRKGKKKQQQPQQQPGGSGDQPSTSVEQKPPQEAPPGPGGDAPRQKPKKKQGQQGQAQQQVPQGGPAGDTALAQQQRQVPRGPAPVPQHQPQQHGMSPPQQWGPPSQRIPPPQMVPPAMAMGSPGFMPPPQQSWGPPRPQSPQQTMGGHPPLIQQLPVGMPTPPGYGGPQQQRGPRPQQSPTSPPPQQQQRGPRPQQSPTSPPPQQQQQQRGPHQQQRQGPQQHISPPPQQQQQWQQQQQRGAQQQQQQRGPPQQQSPTSPLPHQQQQQRGSRPQQMQSPQQATSPPSQQLQRGPPQQRQPSISPQQPQPSPLSSSSTASSPPSKESSPPLIGDGDRLRQLVPVKPGTKGRRIPIESNHLALNLGQLKQAVHYDVAIDPDTPKILLRDVMNVFQKKYYPNRFPAFDGRKNLYTPTKLPFGDTISGKVSVRADNRDKEFKVEVKFARFVDLSPLHDMLKSKSPPQDALQCLDIVLRNAPANRCITAGRCFYTPPSQIINLGDGMEMYYGFYQSAIRGWKPLLNVDISHKAFPSALNLLDLICELGSNFRYTMRREDLGRPIDDNLYRSLEKFLRQLKVKYEITGQPSSKRIHRVNGLGESAAKAKFKLENGQVITVAQYFQDIKRIRLQYPHLPTVWVGAKDRDSKVLLPLEFCSVVEGQAVNRRTNETQTSAMIKKSATSTDVRKDKIMASLKRASYNNDPCIREFGFSVNSQFERLDARVLEPPALVYAENSVIKPSKGVWRPDKSKFLVGACIRKWTIACVTRQPCRVENLADMIFRLAGQSGMQMQAKATPPFSHVSGRQNLQDIIQYFKGKQDFDLIFVVVPNNGPQYSFVKQAAELNVGCLTQCIKERTVMKLNAQTVINILLKVNSKMNGTNHSFHSTSRPAIMNRPCMIMGADVTHPSPDAKDIPSVAAVTASHDPKAFQYNICWRLQTPKLEIIEDLCNITVEQLKFFYEKTRCKPERIVFFRDGVSEGQFKEVQKAEIRAIRQACKKLQGEGYEPSITFLVVQKRHHTRLFPTNPHDSEDKNKNVPAGTCVDTLITNPLMQDFYLVSHASIQGVAKPTKYCTLWDENNMSNDAIEELAYHLCHMFTRCNRSVSYPAPTYYAHLAAARAKVYIENDKLNLEKLKEHQGRYQIKESICKEKPMFFV